MLKSMISLVVSNSQHFCSISWTKMHGNVNRSNNRKYGKFWISFGKADISYTDIAKPDLNYWLIADFRKASFENQPKDPSIDSAVFHNHFCGSTSTPKMIVKYYTFLDEFSKDLRFCQKRTMKNPGLEVWYVQDFSKPFFNQFEKWLFIFLRAFGRGPQKSEARELSKTSFRNSLCRTYRLKGKSCLFFIFF